MKTVFINNSKKEKGLNDFIRPAHSGPYGIYSTSPSGLNYSEKKMKADGWQLMSINHDEFESLIQLELQISQAIQEQYTKQKLQQRADQINICLKSAPIKIEANIGGSLFVSAVANLSGTSMFEAYQGSGKGTAYVNGSNELVAFHYGYEQPENIPANCKAVRVHLSATQICF